MTVKSVFFSQEMARALIDGRKTQERQVLNPQPNARDVRLCGLIGQDWGMRAVFTLCSDGGANSTLFTRVPYATGDLLRVYEEFARTEIGNYVYRSTFTDKYGVFREDIASGCNDISISWQPGAFMLGSMTRLTLEVTDVRVQRVQDISEEDAEAEGIEVASQPTGGDDFQCLFKDYSEEASPEYPWFVDDSISSFRTFWDSIHGPGAWGRNDWVCVLTLDVHHENVDRLLFRRGEKR